MGLAHSGNIADLVLWNLADKWTLGRGVRKAFTLRGFWRFRDDVLAISDAPFEKIQRWYSYYRRRASSIFDMKVELVSKTKVDMLALEVLKTNDARSIRTRPKIKKPGPVLGLHSAHPASCVLGWPSALVSLYMRYSTEESDAGTHAERLLDRLVSNHFSTELARLLVHPTARKPRSHPVQEQQQV